MKVEESYPRAPDVVAYVRSGRGGADEERMAALEVVADSPRDVLGTVQEMCDGAMAVFAEMHRDWHGRSRQVLGQSLPWPSAEDLPHAA